MAKVYNLNKEERHVGSICAGECFYFDGIPCMRINGFDVERGYVPVVNLKNGEIETLSELDFVDNYIVYNAIGLNICDYDAEEMNDY